MSTERRKLFLDRLFITDVGENAIEQRKGASFASGKIAAILIEQSEEPEGFHCNGLSSGVRSGKDDPVDSLLQNDRNRNRFLFQERVAGIEEPDLLAVKLNDRAPLFMNPAGKSIVSVCPSDGLSELKEQLFFFFCFQSEFMKNLRDFNQNPVADQQHGVVQVDEGERFHEHRLAA